MHGSLNGTPAMAAKVASHPWSIEEFERKDHGDGKGGVDELRTPSIRLTGFVLYNNPENDFTGRCHNGEIGVPKNINCNS